MNAWPNSAYIAMAVVISLGGLATFWTYSVTKDSYRAIGFNEGQLEQRVQVKSKLQRILNFRDCTEFHSRDLIDFLSVKTEIIRIVKDQNGGAYFCL